MTGRPDVADQEAYYNEIINSVTVSYTHLLTVLHPAVHCNISLISENETDGSPVRDVRES